MRLKTMPNETSRLRTLLRSEQKRICFTRHSRVEMVNDAIIEADVRRVLVFGYVTWIEQKKDTLWHVEGQDVDGRSIRIVLAIDEAEHHLKIVTVMTV